MASQNNFSALHSDLLLLVQQERRLAALKLCAVLPEIKNKINQGSLSLTTIARASRVLKTKSIDAKLSMQWKIYARVKIHS